MEYKNDDLGVSFTMPERITVRQQLRFRGAIFRSAGDADVYIRYWQAAITLFEDWQCELIPDPAALDLDNEDLSAGDTMKIADIVTWTGNTVAGHMAALRDVDPNS